MRGAAFFDDLPFLHGRVFVDAGNAASAALRLEQAACNRREALLAKLARRFPLARRYFSDMLHDSTLLRICSHADRLALFLDEFSSHCLFDVVAEISGLTTGGCIHRSAPLEIVFEGARSISVARVSRHNLISRCRLDAIKPDFEWIHDELAFVGKDTFSMGIWFATPRGSAVFLRFEAESVRFKEGQERTFKRLFGRDAIGIFRAFWKARATRPFDCSTVREFVSIVASKRRVSVRGSSP